MNVARSVRELAREAHRVLGQAGDDRDAQALLDAIESLEERLEPGTAADLGRWLARLRQLVEEQISTPV